MTKPFTGAELETTEYVYLLEVFFAGQTLRWASADVEVATEDGDRLYFPGQLEDVAFSDEFDLLDDSPRQASAGFELLFPIDVAELEAYGHDLSAATGELSLWAEGRTYEERIVILSGTVTEPEAGDATQKVAFSIEDNAFDDTTLYPKATARISKQTWPTAPEDSLNTIYVIPFNRPGYGVDEDGTVLELPGTPAYLVDRADSSTEMNSIRVLVAGCHVVEGTVTLHDKKLYSANKAVAVYQTVRQVVNTYDELGQPCAVLYLDGRQSFHGDGTPGWWADEDGEYFLIWDGTARGMKRIDGEGAMTGAGEIMRFIYMQSSQDLDYGRFAVAERVLNDYEISGFIDDEINPHTWVGDNLLELLPITIVNGHEGLYPLVWNMDATVEDAVAHLVEGEQMWRESDQRVATGRSSDLVNEVRVSYLLDGDTGKYRLSYTLTGDRSLDLPTAYHCELSFARYGSKPEKIESNLITSNLTARRVAMWWTRAKAFPPKTMPFLVDRKFAGLSIGDVVTLESAGLHWQQQIALVKAIEYRNTILRISFLLVRDPARDKLKKYGSLYWGEPEGAVWGEPESGKWGEP